MNKVNRITSTIFLIICLLNVSFSVRAQPSDTIEEGSRLQLAYTSDLVNNITGGKQTGTSFLGMAALTLRFTTESVNLWHSGVFFLKTVHTHGGTPSETMIGDFQTISNIEAGTHTYVQELWYRQRFGLVDITIGLQDMNATFACNEYSGMYLNSSFGIHSTIAADIPAPIFPLTSPGMTVTWKISDQWTWSGALFDGSPISFKKNPYNLKWHLDAHDGVLSVAEIQYTTLWNGQANSRYALGIYNHNHLYVLTEERSEYEIQYKDNYGIYCTYDQLLWSRNGRRVTAFARASTAPKNINENYFFAGMGLNYYGLFRSDTNDILGLGFVHACLRNTRYETAVECTYQTPVTDLMFLQPDVQYILQPSGAGIPRSNCLIVTCRVGITI